MNYTTLPVKEWEKTEVRKLTGIGRAVRSDQREFIKNVHMPFYSRMGWEHGEECICRKSAKVIL